jgi:hypothetical protein
MIGKVQVLQITPCGINAETSVPGRFRVIE